MAVLWLNGFHSISFTLLCWSESQTLVVLIYYPRLSTMRFYTVIVISSFLATVFAAPHIQQNHDMNTILERRVYHAVATSSKTSGQPSATAKPGLTEISFDEKDVGKKTIHDSEGPDWELEYFNYPLKHYKGQNDLILREFGKDRLKDFQKEVEKVKAAKRYVDSGIHYDSTKSTVSKLFRRYTYVIILTTKAGMSFLEDPSDDESQKGASRTRS
ncbi:hypothetical protein F5051DRAFT_222181 [Lentinula edodes]|nr:hypothetical protein F5051DRAFT_222181 [Lentinula edodes]